MELVFQQNVPPPSPPPDSISMDSYAKHPQLNIEPFHGDQLQFQPIWDCFNESIHTANMKKIIEFTHLKNYVKRPTR